MNNRYNIISACLVLVTVLTIFPRCSDGEWKAFVNNSVNIQCLLDEVINNTFDDIEKECHGAQKTDSNDDLIREGQRLMEESRKLNKEWDDEYLDLLSKLQDINIKREIYTSLVSREGELDKLICV